MKNFSKVLVFSSFIPLASAGAVSDSKNSFFNADFFSLAKKKERAFDAASAIYVLSSEDIRRSGATTIPDALRSVPGVQVAKIDGHKWAISVRGFNAQFSNKLLIMIDGRTIYTPLFSGGFWDIHDYVMEDIDRIEVVRGPGGTIWGANAVNGVINIITKSAVQTQGVYFSQIIGDEDKSVTELRYGGSTKSKDNYRIYAKRSVRDGNERYASGVDNDDGYYQDRAGFRYDVSSIKNNKITVSGDILNGKAQNYFNTLSNPNRNDKTSRGVNLLAKWDRKISKKSDFTLQTYYDYDQFELPVLQRSARTLDVDFQHFYNFSKNNQFIWGLGYRQIEDHIKESEVGSSKPLSYDPDERNDELFTAFIQDKMSIIPGKLDLTIGSKFEKNDFTGFEYQPNLRVAYYPSRSQTLWSAVSRSVRTPTRGEDSINITASGITGLQKGSNTYDSEKTISYELGYRIKPSNKLMFDIATYVNKYDDLRTFELDPGSSVRTTTFNYGTGESYGVEFLTKWQASDDLRMELSYDYQKMDLHLRPHSTNDSTLFKLDAAEGQFPEHQFKLKSFYNFSPKVEFDNVLYYVSDLPDSRNSTDSRGIPSYFKVDTRLGYLATSSLDLSVGIKNLFDKRHREFNNALFNVDTEVGRTIYFKLVWQY